MAMTAPMTHSGPPIEQNGEYEGIHSALTTLVGTKKVELVKGQTFYERIADPNSYVRSVGVPSAHNKTSNNTLALGYTKALLAIASGQMGDIRYRSGGMYGEIVLRSLSSGQTKTMGWAVQRDAQNKSVLVCGPMPWKTGTYQVGMIQFAFALSVGGAAVDEFVVRWAEFLAEMRLCRPGLTFWTPGELFEQIVTMSAQNGAVTKARLALESATDSLRYVLEAMSMGEPHVQYDNPLDNISGPMERFIEPSTYMNATAVATLGTPSTGATHSAAARGRRAINLPTADDTEEEAAPEIGEASPSGAPAPIPSPFGVMKPALVKNSVYKIVERAVLRDGATMLVGPTSTGKTAMGSSVLMSDWLGPKGKLFTINFNDNVRSDLVMGVNRAEGTTFEWVDGPALEAARYVLDTGEKAALVLNEVARAHRSVAALIIDWLETYDEASLLKMGKTVPHKDKHDKHYLITAHDRGESLVVPRDRLKLVMTANIGESNSQSLSLSDPALRRRFGSWRWVPEPTRSEIATILALKIGLKPSSPLVDAMLKVSQAIKEERHKEQNMVMPLNLDLLTKWGLAFREQYEHALRTQTIKPVKQGTSDKTRAQERKDGTAPTPPVDIAAIFSETASDIWVDMLPKMDGDEPNADAVKFISDRLAQYAPKQV